MLAEVPMIGREVVGSAIGSWDLGRGVTVSAIRGALFMTELEVGRGGLGESVGCEGALLEVLISAGEEPG